MVNAISSIRPRNLLASPCRLLGVGIGLGSISCAVVAVVPDHLQLATALVGLSLMLGCIAVALVPLAKDAGLEWWGTSPVIAMMLGALPFVGVAALHHFESRPAQMTLAVSASGARAAPARLSMTGAAFHPDTVAHNPGKYPVATSTGQTKEQEAASQAPISGLVDGVGSILNGPARSAVRGALSLLPIASTGDPERFKSRAAAAVQALVNVETSLRSLSNNPSYAEKVDQVLGDMEPIAKLKSTLEQPGGSPDGAEQLRVAAAEANRWITECDRRIAALNTGYETDTPPANGISPTRR